MSSRPVSQIAADFQRKVQRLDSTRKRIESAYQGGALHLVDVESTYSGLFLQLVVEYEAAIESFVLGLIVRPGGYVSSAGSRARVNVRSYAHALKLASGPGSKYPSWIGKTDLEDIAELLLVDSLPFKRTAPPVNWHYVNQARYIRNAIAHPSEHAIKQFQKHVIQNTPLPSRERKVAGYLRGRSAVGQTRWEVNAAGLNSFVSDLVR